MSINGLYTCTLLVLALAEGLWFTLICFVQVALNKNQQKPVDAAKCNGEKGIVTYLEGLEAKKSGGQWKEGIVRG